MNNQNTILGAGAISAAVLVLKSFATGDSFTKPLLGIAIGTILLAALDAAGIGEIAAPLAVLLAVSTITIYAFPLLDKVKDYF